MDSSYQFLMEKPQKGHLDWVKRNEHDDDEIEEKIHSSIDGERDITKYLSKNQILSWKYYEGVWVCICDITLQILQNWWMLEVANENDSVGAYWIKDWVRMITACVSECVRKRVWEKQRQKLNETCTLYYRIYSYRSSPFCGCTHVHRTRHARIDSGSIFHT